MKVVMRQNQSGLDDTQKDNFVNVVLDLKAAQSGDTNAYDELVTVHRDTEHPDGTNDAHRGPAFFPWHRNFLKGFEDWLQFASGDETMGLPYWDWSVDPFPNFLGGDGSGSDGKVVDGPFAYDARPEGDPRKWTLNVRSNEERTPYLKRRFGKNIDPPVRTLPNVQNVYYTIGQSPYDVDPWDDTSNTGFRNTAEGFIGDPAGVGMHNRIHLWVGGSMIPMTSPNDPVFFLHHCFVDKLWADWQGMHPDQQPYLPADGGRQGLNEAMPPWTVTPRYMLNHHYFGYRYDTESYMLAWEELYPGQWIWSSDKRYYLWYRKEDGILLLAQTSSDPTRPDQTLWQSTDSARPLGRCIMREDGNLLIYHLPAGRYDPNPIWQSGTPGHPNGYLSVQRSGYVGLFPSGGGNSYWWQPR